jgi:hypothetical protein
MFAMRPFGLRAIARILLLITAFVLTAPATAAQIGSVRPAPHGARIASLHHRRADALHGHRIFVAGRRVFHPSRRFVVIPATVGLGDGYAYPYPYPCDPNTDACCPSNAYSGYAPGCAGYYGGPYVGFGFDDFFIAPAFRRRVVFLHHFRPFDSRFVHGPVLVHTPAFVPGRFVAGPGFGHGFSQNFGIHGGFMHGGGGMMRR